ncbi:hexokinase-1-like [Macrosteles quadrilineatus]|uniref:hexokinase-1-like n=1 Tax=Macrosteles quadrilineatus TaxID=74068 RepID=UPI0023E31A84|nr:hexokinase-1-like [Macrosteles quadrilineatus]
MAVNRATVLKNLNEAIKVSPLKITDEKKKAQIDEKLKGIHIDGPTVLRIGEVFLKELELGIRDKPSSLLMENTYIPELPDGTEEGQFLALDLGGTNFRVLHLVLHKGRIVKEQSKHYHIDDELRLGCGLKLFDFIAECISSFVHEHNLADQTLPLGFTFSFPMHQRSLSSGILVTWTKSFTTSGVEGEDTVRLLREAMQRRGDNHVEVVAILNDTTGTLLQGALLDHRTTIGLIIGTGSNACYLERADRVQHWETERHGEREIIIDTEWGAFGDNGTIDFIKTDYDRQVDNNSLIKNSFTFEKYISGKYMGEIVRVILLDFAKSNLIFNGELSKKLQDPNSFTTANVSSIEEDCINNVTLKTEEILKSYGQKYTQEDIVVLKYICEIVSLRAALLVSICCAELLKHMNRPDSTVAVDGSLYKHHPRMKQWMNTFIPILAPLQKCRLLLALDGSGKGAGLAAAIAMKLKSRSNGVS